MKTSENFYVETAKFAFCLIGGGTAGYFLAKGANIVVSKASELAQAKLVTKLAERMSNGEGQASTEGGLQA